MATFADVDDELVLSVVAKGELVSVAISGTYDQVIDLQKEKGSPGSGAWEQVKRFNTEDATEAYTFQTEMANEKWRLYLTTDDGGSATVTMTDGDMILHQEVDAQGVVKMTIRQSGVTMEDALTVDGASTLTGAVTATAGVLAKETILDIADATNTLTLGAAHVNRKLRVLDATLAITLPEATGSGDWYEVVQGIAATASTFVTADTSNATFKGMLHAYAADDEGVVGPWPAIPGDDTITYNGAATGGALYDNIKFVDFAADVWLVSGYITETGGSEATPFSSAA